MSEYKGYEIVNADGNNCRLKRIKSIGKGSIPMVLTGMYTTCLLYTSPSPRDRG